MERLTKRNEYGRICAADGVSTEKILERLEAYEDTELEPRDIKVLKLIHGMPAAEIVRICNLYRAEKESRLIVPPCKVGDVIYRHGAKTPVMPCIVTSIYRSQANDGSIIEEVLYTFGNGLKAGAYFEDFGKTVFLTREEAEAALKGADNNEPTEIENAAEEAQRMGTSYGQHMYNRREQP